MSSQSLFKQFSAKDSVRLQKDPVNQGLATSQYISSENINYSDIGNSNSSPDFDKTCDRESRSERKLCLKDYLFLTQALSKSVGAEEKIKLSKKEYRKEKYKLESEKVIGLLNYELNLKIEDVIASLRNIQSEITGGSKKGLENNDDFNNETEDYQRQKREESKDFILEKNKIKTLLEDKLIPIVSEVEALATFHKKEETNNLTNNQTNVLSLSESNQNPEEILKTSVLEEE